MKRCIFCQILNGEKPAFSIYEDGDVRVILDIDPINEGHLLILPKGHFSDADELPETLYMKIQLLARRLITVLKEVYGCDGYTVMQNGGSVSAIGHYHLHVVPRYVRDGFFVMTGGVSYHANERIAEKIRNRFAASDPEQTETADTAP